MIIESYVINPTVIIFYRLNKTEYSHVFLIYRHKKKIHTSLPTRFSIIDLDILLFIFVNNFSLILARIIVQDHKSSNRRTLLYMYAYNYKKARSYAVKWEFKLKLFLLSVTRDRKCHCWFPCHFKIRIRSACSLSAELHALHCYTSCRSRSSLSRYSWFTPFARSFSDGIPARGRTHPVEAAKLVVAHEGKGAYEIIVLVQFTWDDRKVDHSLPIRDRMLILNKTRGM